MDTVGCASTGNLANAVAAGAAAAGLPRGRPGARGPGGGQADDDRRLRRHARRRARQLRPREPAVRGDRRPPPLGHRQREPARVLRRGLEDGRLRAGRAARLDAARPRRGAHGRRQPDRQGGEGVPAARCARPGGGHAVLAARRAARGLRADRARLEDRSSSRCGRSSRTRSCAAWPSAIPPTGRRRSRSSAAPAGAAEDPTDAEVLEGIRLLAETEGLFAETAGGTVVAAARRLAEAGAFADGRPRRAADHRPRPEDGRGAGGRAVRGRHRREARRSSSRSGRSARARRGGARASAAADRGVQGGARGPSEPKLERPERPPMRRGLWSDLFDTTLRDGTQSEGLSLSVEDKLKIARAARRVRHPLHRGRLAGLATRRTPSSSAAREVARRSRQAKLTAFGSTRKAGVRAEDDVNLRALLEAETPGGGHLRQVLARCTSRRCWRRPPRRTWP